MSATVSTQRDPRGSRRWAYVISKPGEWPYVSQYRWFTEPAARAAGEQDLAASEELDS